METVKLIGENKRPVLRFPFNGDPRCLVIVSFKHRTISAAHLAYHTRYQEPFTPDEALLTFFYAGDKCGAEWEPQHGPIMLYTKCAPDWKGEMMCGSPLTAKEHWYYDWVEDNALAWSQHAVDKERLKEKLNRGDFESIFQVLKRWADRDSEGEGER